MAVRTSTAANHRTSKSHSKQRREDACSQRALGLWYQTTERFRLSASRAPGPCVSRATAPGMTTNRDLPLAAFLAFLAARAATTAFPLCWAGPFCLSGFLCFLVFKAVAAVLRAPASRVASLTACSFEETRMGRAQRSIQALTSSQKRNILPQICLGSMCGCAFQSTS